MQAWLSENPDESLLRWVFRSVLIISIAVLGTDLAERSGWLAASDPASQTDIRPEAPAPDAPVAPSILAPWLKRMIPLP
ncbi:hypothetical protein ABTH88_20855, partial [Acinetobacter baumannii]